MRCPAFLAIRVSIQLILEFATPSIPIILDDWLFETIVKDCLSPPMSGSRLGSAPDSVNCKVKLFPNPTWSPATAATKPAADAGPGASIPTRRKRKRRFIGRASSRRTLFQTAQPVFDHELIF